MYEYVKGGDAPYKTQKKVSDAVFASKETVKEARSLIGDSEVNALGERRLSNSLRGKTSTEALKWLDSNPWVKDIPGADKKTLEYLRVLAEREGSAETLKKVKAALQYAAKGAAITAGGGAAYEVGKAVF